MERVLNPSLWESDRRKRGTMGQMKISGPVAAVIVIVALIVVALIGNHFMNPPQKLDAQAQSMMEGIRRSRPPGTQ